MSKTRYVPPTILKSWVNDIPGGARYELMVLGNDTVCAACGRSAHDSGSSSCSWQAFLEGHLHGLIEKTMGQQALAECLDFVLQSSTSSTS
jgi:hypothetical protein